MDRGLHNLMSCKKVKRVAAPGHGTSLVEEELEARSSLAVQKRIREKKKNIEDPTLGADLTKKILKTAALQLDEENMISTSVDFPTAEQIEDMEEDIALEFDLENNDEESRQLFELFKPDMAFLSRQMDKKLKKTRHEVDPQVREIYTQLGGVLKIYKSGKLPKAVNAIASQKISGWFDLLQLSEPEHWSVNAMKAVTMLFAQSASDDRCQRFYTDILLENVRDILDGAKKVPVQIFQALAIAARRPIPFTRGILLPMSEEPRVTLKEARVISAIVGRVKLPKDHTNAFIIKICRQEVTPTRSLFLSRFINKGQALCIETIDAVVAYFLQFQGTEDKQLLIWHKTLLDFVRKYGKDILPEQRDALAELLRQHHHKDITPEIFKVFSEVPPRDGSIPIDEPPVPML